MKFMLISDNIDTIVGLRLAGIEGVIAHKEDEVRHAVKEATDNPEVGIVLITERLSALCHELIYEIKMHQHRPLLVEIPDRHGSGRTADSITKYVREAIGAKV